MAQTVQGLLGVRPDAATGQVATGSHLPAAIGWLHASAVRVGTNLITVRHDGARSSTSTNASGPAEVRWLAQFVGSHRSVTVDGKSAPTTIGSQDVVTVSTVDIKAPVAG